MIDNEQVEEILLVLELNQAFQNGKRFERGLCRSSRRTRKSAYSR